MEKRRLELSSQGHIETSDVLDECLTLLAEDRATVEECLARYPEHAADLRPLLELSVEIRRVPRPTLSLAASAAGKRRMLDALAEKKRRRPGALPRLKEWIAALFGGDGMSRAPALQVALSAAAALIILIGGGLLANAWLGTTVARLATLETAEGLVEVQPAGSSSWQPTSPSRQLTVGDRIRTAAGASATLVFFDGSTTALEGETEITLVQMRSRRDGTARVIALHQQRGRTHYRVEPLRKPDARFQVRTPTAVTLVRGTAFDVAVEADGTTQVAVWEGLVEVSSDHTTVELQPGWFTSVRPNLPPSTPAAVPTPLSTEKFPELPTPPIATATVTAPTSSEVEEISEPTATPRPTDTPAPTDTPEPSQGEPTELPATSTPLPPTATPTSLPPTATFTPLPPTATPTPEGPPADTPPPPRPTATFTPLPPTATPMPEEPPMDTPPPPGPTATPTQEEPLVDTPPPPTVTSTPLPPTATPTPEGPSPAPTEASSPTPE